MFLEDWGMNTIWYGAVQAHNLLIGLTFPRCFLLTHLALLSSLSHISSSEGWHKDPIDFLCYGLIHECPFHTFSPSDPTTFVAGFLILSNFSELLAINFTVLYQALFRYFFIPFDFLFGISFCEFSLLMCLFLSDVLTNKNTFFKLIYKLTKIESSLNIVFKGLKLK